MSCVCSLESTRHKKQLKVSVCMCESSVFNNKLGNQKWGHLYLPASIRALAEAQIQSRPRDLDGYCCCDQPWPGQGESRAGLVTVPKMSALKIPSSALSD